MASQLTRHWKLVLFWTLSLVVVAVASSWAAAAQGVEVRGRPGLILEVPTVISGSDLGFRIERTMDGIQVGKIVVRINGVWVDTDAPPVATR